MSDFDEDMVNDLTLKLFNQLPMGYEREYINALFKTILVLLDIGETDEDDVKGLFKHMYEQYLIQKRRGACG